MNRDISKLLSHVLRHAPDRLGITLDVGGWTDVEILIARARDAGFMLDRALLEIVVAESDKKRFTLSPDGARIRAAQGHSVPVDLGLEPVPPPDVLFHGTARRNLPAILAEGVNPGQRLQVHLSPDVETAVAVGRRHGVPVVLRVAAGRMREGGFYFFQADNGVWLTDFVPPAYLSV